MNKTEEIKEKFGKLERIGVISSPSSTASLSIDILGTAVYKRLVGSLCCFNFIQENIDNYALGQITEIGMRNNWIEGPTMRSLVRQRGVVEPITGRQDYHFATMNVGSVLKVSNNVEPSILGTVPSTGTLVSIVNDDMMNALLKDYKSEFSYLGKVYGNETKMPMWFKHFGDKKSGGNGEAYHIGIFGKTGSGKSVLSKMITLSYAKNKPMTIFILDPQGEFTKLKNESTINELFKNKLKKDIQFISIKHLILWGRELFKRILTMSGFFDNFRSMREDKKELAVKKIVDWLLDKAGEKVTLSGIKMSLQNFYKEEVFDEVMDELSNEKFWAKIYSGDGKESIIEAVKEIQSNTTSKSELYKLWYQTCNLFRHNGDTKKVSIKDLVDNIKGTEIGKFIVIDLSDDDIDNDIIWNDEIRKLVINELLKAIKTVGSEQYKKGELLNTLIVIDEAHRIIPRELNDEFDITKELISTIKDGVNTTRKYGIGWMFISQTLSGINSDVIKQIRTYIFGYGLSYGVERQSLKEIIGGQDDYFNLYQTFKDPEAGIGTPEYSFMAIGPMSPLSFSGNPLFFTTFNFPKEFLEDNFRDFNND